MFHTLTWDEMKKLRRERSGEKSPDEKTIKNEVRKRDGFCCRSCGITADECKAEYGTTLDVHRILPGVEYRVDGCIALCEGCHNEQIRQAGTSLVERRHPLVWI